MIVRAASLPLAADAQSGCGGTEAVRYESSPDYCSGHPDPVRFTGLSCGTRRSRPRQPGVVATKGRGRHASFGTLYYRCLVVVFGSMALLSVVRWAEDYHLFILGTLALTAAVIARRAVRRQRVRLHLIGMGTSYILLLTAFYVDNGAHLPVWRDLPPLTYWLLPAAIGLPLIFVTLRRHPLAHAERRRAHPEAAA